MSTPFQNRLVGTIIVAAAVIIFLPDVLDGKKKSNQTDFEPIPTAPAFTGKMNKKPFPADKFEQKEQVELVEETPLDENTKPATKELAADTKDTTKQLAKNNQVTPAKKADEIVANDAPKTKQSSKTAKTESAISKPKLGLQPEKAVNKEAWVIQLGSFKHKKNVEELLAKLKNNGYTAFTKPIKTKQGSLTKVFVGPELIKSSIEKKIPALKKLTDVQGKVAKYYPTR